MKDTCGKCAKKLGEETMISPYEVSHKLYAGIRVMLLNAAHERVCTACNTPVIDIPDAEGLTAAVVIARATDPVKLNGAEIKFMRKAMDLSAKKLASRLEVTEETISRWENDKQPIGGANEKIFRYLACKALAPSAPAIHWSIDAIMNMEIGARINNEHITLCFERTKFKTQPEEPAKAAWTEEAQAA